MSYVKAFGFDDLIDRGRMYFITVPHPVMRFLRYLPPAQPLDVPQPENLRLLRGQGINLGQGMVLLSYQFIWFVKEPSHYALLKHSLLPCLPNSRLPLYLSDRTFHAEF